MSDYRRVIETPAQVRSVMAEAFLVAKQASVGGKLMVTLSKLDKSRQQECKYHAIIADIYETGDVDGVPMREKVSDAALLKAVLVGRFEYELLQQGVRLRKPGRFAYDWERMTPVTERASTRDFSVREARNFIDFLHAEGARYNVQWSPIVTRIYEEMTQKEREE